MKMKKRLFAAVITSITCVGVVGLTACGNGGNGNESEEPSIVLTENTDFNALVSEKVNEDGWRNAFDSGNYGNCTIKLINDFKEEGTFNYLRKQQTDNLDVKIIFTSEFDGIKESEYWKSENGIKYSFLDGSWQIIDESDSANADNFEFSYKFICPDFSGNYKCFSYNEQTGVYEFNGDTTNVLITNSILENWENKYLEASVKIINGKIACVYAKDDDSEAQIYFYDYGTTTITLPECQ